MKMQKISPHLWFDNNAREAANFYLTIFKNAKLIDSGNISGTPSGSVEMLRILLEGYEFSLISAGQYFKANPSISFIVAYETEEDVRKIWNHLIDGGIILMELGSYPFSRLYGWAQDKYGVSWQIIFMEGDVRDVLMPALMFVGNNFGKGEEAINFYTSIFYDAECGTIMRYENESPELNGKVMYANFKIEGQQFALMENNIEHGFNFTEAISFIVYCDTQEEIDYYWEKLSCVPEAEQCGWLKDKYGISWQIVPRVMTEMLVEGDVKKKKRVTEAFLKMKKFDIEELQNAYEGEE